MVKGDLILRCSRNASLRGAMAVCGLALTTACASPPANPIQDKTAAKLCAEANYDPNVMVFRDESSSYKLAAIGVTGGGNLKDFGAIVGPSVITSRGGAMATKGGTTDIEARTCDQFQP